MSHSFLIESWDFSTFPAKRVEPTEPLGLLQEHHWYHCQREAKELRHWLLANDFETGVVDSLLADDTRPRFELFEDQSFLLIMRGVNLNEGAMPDDMLSVRILWHKGILISTRKISSKAITEIRQALDEQRGPKTTARLLLAIIDGLNQNIAHFLDTVEDQLFEIEEGNGNHHDLHVIHKRLLKLRRFMKPQRYAHDDFLEVQHPEMEDVELKMRNSLDTVIRINESIDFYLEQIQLIKADIEQDQAEKMNRNTYLFTVIAAIFLPVSFLTGLLGINIGGIPGVDNPMAFMVFCVGLVVTFIFEFILLRWLKFF
ncbi:zinc transporter ZntB [Vibrio aphrogenes]|uniref:zinc transporter ZntB n=1 Tax=Vibrio aphrogenes TaxID=1891186 RepID=UPI000B361C9A|nr:zinc transporter ZntB [Vibrio aphrogenes]